MRARVISFILGASLFLLLHFCGRIPERISDRGTEREADTITRTITLTDTIKKRGLPLVTQKTGVSEPSLPEPDTVRDTVRDTVSVFRDFYRERSYLKEYRDSFISASFRAEVYRNRLDSVSFSYNLLKETKVRERTIKKDPLSFYGGATVTPRTIAPGIFIKKGRFLGGLGYSTRNRVILTAGVKIASF